MYCVKAVDRSKHPNVRDGWELCAEFPLLLPKYQKTTPVIVHKAPVSIRFQGNIDAIKLAYDRLMQVSKTQKPFQTHQYKQRKM